MKHCSQPMNEIRGVICAGLVIQVSGSLVEGVILELSRLPYAAIGICYFLLQLLYEVVFGKKIVRDGGIMNKQLDYVDVAFYTCRYIHMH